MLWSPWRNWRRHRRHHRHRRPAVGAVLALILKGEHPRMAFTFSVGQTATAVLTEFDAAGNVVPSVSQPIYTSDTPSVASVAGNQVTALAIGQANITGTDSGDNIAASLALTVTDVAASGALTLTLNPVASAALKKS